jgi:hypothetical protein
MIFRRIIQQVREQNWTAIAIEFVLLVLGVFLGLQAQEWANERQARSEERALLASLRTEFTEARSELIAQTEKHRRIETDVTYVIETLSHAEQSGTSHATVLDARFAWALIGTTTQLSQGELKGMLSAGRLSLIRNPALRSALADWDSVLADATEDELLAREMTVRQLEPLLWRLMDARPIRDYALLRESPPVPPPATTSEIPVDRELLGALATRRFWLRHTIRELDGPSQEAERIVGLIEASLGN